MYLQYGNKPAIIPVSSLDFQSGLVALPPLAPTRSLSAIRIFGFLEAAA